MNMWKERRGEGKGLKMGESEGQRRESKPARECLTFLSCKETSLIGSKATTIT